MNYKTKRTNTKSTMTKHFVLLDLSYLIFHRYYAIIAWSRLTDNVITDKEEFKSKFQKGFEAFLLKLKKTLDIQDFSDVIMAKDTNRNLIWRNNIFPDYKKNRDVSSKSLDTDVFSLIHEQVIPYIQNKYNIKQLYVQNAEADDLIAITCDYIQKEIPGSTITIIANDNDFVQLVPKNACIKIYNASFVNIVERFDKVTMSVYTEWKIIKGDKSDNIPSIGPKIGDKTALKLALCREALEKKLENSEINRQYNINKKLIDFNEIPDDIKSNTTNLLGKMI